jgi:hypothetical protein
MSQPEDRKRIQLLEPAEDVRPIEQRRRRKERRPGWRKQLRRFTRVGWINTFIALIALVVMVVIAAIAIYVDATNRIGATTSSLFRVIETLGSDDDTAFAFDDFNRLSASVDELSATLVSAGDRLRYLEPLSGFNADLYATLVQIEIGQDLALAAHAMLDGAQPALIHLNTVEPASGETLVSSSERLVELLRAGREQFSAAQTYLAAAERDLAAVDAAALPPGYAQNINALANYRVELARVNELLIQSPDLLTTAFGLAGEQRYLILLQSSERLRPAGGFVVGYGWMTVRSGRINEFAFRNSLPDLAAADEDFPVWWREAFTTAPSPWSDRPEADFSAMAAAMLRLYNSGDNAQVPLDGVIGLDMALLPALLAVNGEVIVPNYNQTVGADTVRDLIFSRDAYGGDTGFITALTGQVFAGLQAAEQDAESVGQLNAVLLRGLREKQMMIYFDDAALTSAAALIGWAGAQTPALGHDYLMIADSNLSNFSNQSILRQVNYAVQLLPDDSLASRVTLSYDYSARTASADPAVDELIYGALDYQNLLHVFVPPGSTLNAVENLSDEAVERVAAEGHQLFVAPVSIPYDSVESFQFSYSGTVGIEGIETFRRYRLLVQKQPGSGTDVVNVQVTLPETTGLVSSAPAPVAAYTLNNQQVLEYRLTLESDRWIEIIYE